jgi:serine/threonine-protein kinase
MGSDAPSLNVILGSIADGKPLDWRRLLSEAQDPDTRDTLDRLRVIADIADFHRTLHGGSATPESWAAREPLEDTASREWTPADPTPPLGRWGRFELLARVGRGSFGEVYRALDTQLDREVAVKLLWADHSSPVLVERLLREARMLARLRHQNVVALYGAEEQEGRAGLWMEFVRGVSLEDLVESHGPMSAREAGLVAQELCRALAAVHQAGLVHQDVKAGNVMREEGGRVVLMDFGAGRLRERASAAGVAGTPLYVAPEVLRGQEPDLRSDIYSLGVLLYHLVTGSYPVRARGLEALLQAHERHERVPLPDSRPDLPDAFVQVVERALAHDPVDRFPSAGAMQLALGRALGFSTVELVPAVREVEGATAKGRARWRALVASIALVASFLALRAWRAGAPVPGTLPVPVRSLAVLPFLTPPAGGLGPDVGQRLAEDLSRRLQRRGVRVIGSESTRLAADLPGSDLARRLGVDAVVRGELRPSGKDLEAIVRLALTGSGKELWSGRYVSSGPQVAGLPGSLARDLSGVLGGGSGVPLLPRAPDLVAYKAYTSGRHYAEERSQKSLELAIRYYQEAVERDPQFAAAWSGLADAYIALGVPTFGALRPQEARRLASQAALRALELDPELSEAHNSLAFLSYLYDWDWGAAERRFLRAITLNPYYAGAHHWYANHLGALGRSEDAMREVHKALELEPLSVLIQRDVAWHLFHQRRYEEAIERLQATLETRPDFVAARTLLGRALVEAGRGVEGLAEMEKVVPQMPPGSGLPFLAYAQAAAGRPEAARRSLASLRRLPADAYVSAYYVALARMKLGQVEETLRSLEEAFREQDPPLVNLKADPRWDPIRDHPRYRALLRRMNFPS